MSQSMPHVTVNDALLQMASVVTFSRGDRFAVRQILKRLADSAWTDGYVDASRDKAEENVADA